jgi:hypothetical protein
MISDILKRVDALRTLPDSWIVTSLDRIPTGLQRETEPITAGDLRALVARVRECEAATEGRRRDELVRVAAAIYAANFFTVTKDQARCHASDLIDRCEGFLPDDEDPEP